MSDAPSTSSETGSRPAPQPVSTARLAVIALAYVAMSVAVLHLSPSPNHALRLFPSAGLALAATLVYGTRALPAVLLGSLGFQLYLYATTGYDGRALLLPALLIPFGAAAQAALGAWWMRRGKSGPLTLDSPRSIGRLFLVGGAAACVVSATWGVGLLWLLGGVGSTRLLPAWLMWWGGDALGVIIGVPAFLTLFGRPRRTWHPRRYTVGLPLLLASLLLSLGMLQVARNDEQRLHTRFERDANDLVTAIGLRLQGHLYALDAVHSVYIASDDVTNYEFERASAGWLRKLPGLQAIGWHERVRRDEIPALEARARAEGDLSFRVFERNSTLAQQDSEVIVMRRAQPRAGNETAIGINALSVAEPRAAIMKARRVDEPVASAGFRLTQSLGEQRGVVVYRAVHRGAAGKPGPVPAASSAGATASDDDDLLGLVFLTLRMDDALNGLLAGGPSYLQTCLLDVTPPGPPSRLAGPADCDSRKADLSYSHRVELPFAGRSWVVDVTAASGVPSLSGSMLLDESSAAWLFYMTGLAATGMMGALLLLVTGRERLTQAAVEQRTHQLQHEIAERQLTERALRESEGRFRSIFKTVPVGMIYTDLAGRIKQANSALCTLTGYSEEELLSLSVATLTHRDDRELDDARRRDLIAGRRPIHRLRMRYVARNGDTRWVRSTVTVLRDAHGAPHRLVALVEDISEHLRLEEAEKARASAETANRAKNEFLSRMSHELRTPLNAMLGFAQLLEMDRTESLHERHRTWVSQIQQAGWHLLEMINDVLDLSRIEAGTLNLQIEPLSLEPLINASLALVEPQARARGITLTRLLADHGSLQLMGDATRVKQILTNLLSNAVKYNRDGGEVQISTRRVAGPDGLPFIEVDVLDTGVGIDAQQMTQLFQPFNRLGRERGSTEGTGIGLVIAKLLAERQGGALSVRSEAGIGSTFTLRMPLNQDEPEVQAESEQGDLGEQQYNRRHVLYIEDNETNVEVMRGIFYLRPQVQLSIAVNGLDGLAAMRTLKPDLVLLDMHLPDIGGMALLEHMKQDESIGDLPVVVVSADALPAQIEAAMHAGAVRYLTKPVAIDEMLSVLDDELARLTTRFG